MTRIIFMYFRSYWLNETFHNSLKSVLKINTKFAVPKLPLYEAGVTPCNKRYKSESIIPLNLESLQQTAGVIPLWNELDSLRKVLDESSTSYKEATKIRTP